MAVEKQPETAGAARALGAEGQRGDPRLQRDDAAEPGGDGDAPLEPKMKLESTQHDQPQPEGTDREREAKEPDAAKQFPRCGSRPPAPSASLTDGAAARTPNVQTPGTTCESAEIASPTHRAAAHGPTP